MKCFLLSLLLVPCGVFGSLLIEEVNSCYVNENFISGHDLATLERINFDCENGLCNEVLKEIRDEDSDGIYTSELVRNILLYHITLSEIYERILSEQQRKRLIRANDVWVCDDLESCFISNDSLLELLVSKALYKEHRFTSRDQYILNRLDVLQETLVSNFLEYNFVVDYSVVPNSACLEQIDSLVFKLALKSMCKESRFPKFYLLRLGVFAKKSVIQQLDNYFEQIGVFFIPTLRDGLLVYEIYLKQVYYKVLSDETVDSVVEAIGEPPLVVNICD